MTQPPTHKSIPESDLPPAAAEAVAPAEATPEPEPWTAERVTEWNAYYDLYVILGVLLLAFVASANRITHASIWSQLQVGRLIMARSAPVTTDPLTYTEGGKPWVNVPWLF